MLTITIPAKDPSAFDSRRLAPKIGSPEMREMIGFAM
jgi:hypothetical protein